jgi:hypothetical protein
MSLNELHSMLSMTESGELSLFLWGHTLETAIFILNRVSTKSVDKTPYKVSMGRVLNLFLLKI